MRRKILPLPNLTFQSRGDTFKPCSAGYQPSKVCFVCPRGRELQKKVGGCQGPRTDWHFLFFKSCF